VDVLAVITPVEELIDNPDGELEYEPVIEGFCVQKGLTADELVQIALPLL
jgi:hypothetical protein